MSPPQVGGCGRGEHGGGRGSGPRRGRCAGCPARARSGPRRAARRRSGGASRQRADAVCRAPAPRRRRPIGLRAARAAAGWHGGALPRARRSGPARAARASLRSRARARGRVRGPGACDVQCAQKAPRRGSGPGESRPGPGADSDGRLTRRDPNRESGPGERRSDSARRRMCSARIGHPGGGPRRVRLGGPTRIPGRADSDSARRISTRAGPDAHGGGRQHAGPARRHPTRACTRPGGGAGADPALGIRLQRAARPLSPQLHAAADRPGPLARSV
jgi:hypothetical protein